MALRANPTSIQLGQHAVLPLPETYPTRDKGRRGAEAQGVWIIFGGDRAWGVARGLKEGKSKAMQRCKSAVGLCKGAKVDDKITEFV